MPPPATDDGHKRRSRRRLIGAVALAIIAVIILPLVLEDEPPPAGPLEVHMPPPADSPQPQNVVEFAPPPANAVVEPAQPEPAAPTRTAKPTVPPKPASAPVKPAAQAVKEAPKPAQASIVYTVQAGVFADKANARRLQDRISALGLKPYTEQVGDSTRVSVGSFANRAEADALLAKLVLAGITDVKVVEK